MLLFRIISRLLSYPDERLMAALPDMRRALQEAGRIPAEQRRGLEALIGQLMASDLLAAQERYVDLFDRVRSLSLHLFEHVHGDSRDRGMAMVRLRELYRAQGLDIAANELPDYLPLYLEFLSVLPEKEARAQLQEPAPILAGIEARLVKRASPYSAAFSALLWLAAHAPLAAESLPEADDSYEAMDREWEEAAVIFGPEAMRQGDAAQSCDRAQSMLRRMGLS